MKPTNKAGQRPSVPSHGGGGAGSTRLATRRRTGRLGARAFQRASVLLLLLFFHLCNKDGKI